MGDILTEKRPACLDSGILCLIARVAEATGRPDAAQERLVGPECRQVEHPPVTSRT